MTSVAKIIRDAAKQETQSAQEAAQRVGGEHVKHEHAARVLRAITAEIEALGDGNARRIAEAVREACASRALDQIERRMRSCHSLARAAESRNDNERRRAMDERAIECSHLGTSVMVAIGGPHAPFRNLPDIPDARQLQGLDLDAIIKRAMETT